MAAEMSHVKIFFGDPPFIVVQSYGLMFFLRSRLIGKFNRQTQRLMTDVTVVAMEETEKGDMIELILDTHFTPAIGMILMDENSATWEITGILHDPKRVTDEDHGKRYTMTCQGVNTERAIHTGKYKLLH